MKSPLFGVVMKGKKLSSDINKKSNKKRKFV